MRTKIQVVLLALGVTLQSVSAVCDPECAISRCFIETPETTSAYQQCFTETCGCSLDLYNKIMSSTIDCMTSGFAICNPDRNQAIKDQDSYDECRANVIGACYQMHLTEDIKKSISQNLACFDDTLTLQECEALTYRALFDSQQFIEPRQQSLGLNKLPKLASQIRKHHVGSHQYSFVSIEQSDQNYNNFTVQINDTAIWNFFKDLQELQMEYEASRKQSAMEVVQAIQDRYKMTLAKVYLDFGKLYYPKAKAYAETIKRVVPNSACNQQCFIEQCLQPAQATPQCLQLCNCTFDQQGIQEAINSYTNESRQFHRNVTQYLTESWQSLMPSLMKFKQRETQLTYKLYDFIENQAVNVGGCEPVCVDQCTTPGRYNLHQIGHCLQKCECEGGIIRLADGRVDQDQLNYYSGNNAEAMSFFNNNFIF